MATLGPASFGRERDLVEAGASEFRLNASHLTVADLTRSLDRVAAAVPGARTWVDLQGAKMRLGAFRPRRLDRGDRVHLALRGGGAALPVPHPELFRAARPGWVLSSDDDRMRLRVVSVGETSLVAEAESDGLLSPRKGLNATPHPVEIADLFDLDLERLVAAVAFEHAAFAVSFVKDGTEAAWIRRRAPGRLVALKVERREAVDAFDRVVRASDVVWICRGDLGAQLGVARMASWIGDLRPPRAPPTLMAGQVLEHLTRHAEPTRSEVCHLHDLSARGYAGVVLSDETAVGHDPIGAVAAASKLLRVWRRGYGNK